MKFDYEAELPTRHHWVYPSGAMTDIQKEGTVANPLTTVRQRRTVVRGGSLHSYSGFSVTAPPG